MNPMLHTTYASIRHQELIAESSQLRRRSALRRLAKAAKLHRQTDQRSSRAADLVARTHS